MDDVVESVGANATEEQRRRLRELLQEAPLLAPFQAFATGFGTDEGGRMRPLHSSTPTGPRLRQIRSCYRNAWRKPGVYLGQGSSVETRLENERAGPTGWSSWK